METSQKLVVFAGGHPILNVKNVATSLDYYCTRLGFERNFFGPGDNRPRRLLKSAGVISR